MRNSAPLFLPHFNLQAYNTLAVPAIADFFVSVGNNNELLNALTFAREKKLPLLVLGGGSNIVLQNDVHGLVIHVQMFGKELVREDDQFYYVRAAAGENWHEFVEYCLAANYFGLENLSLIPGTVGAAPIQNIGAYGIELKDVFSELTAIDVQSGLVITFTREACQFAYRDSVFKNALLDKYIITSVTFQLRKSPETQSGYPALKSALADYSADEITPALVSQVVCDIRRSKLPDPKQIPNVGSFFKNPIVSLALLARIQASYPNVVYYPAGEGQVKLAAGWLIDQAGWKGVIDGAAVHAQQALVLTNPARLKGEVVIALANKICSSIEQRFGVSLEQEPRNYP